MTKVHTTFCVFGHFLTSYIQRGVVPYFTEPGLISVESFLALQLKPGDEDPVIRIERITDSVRSGGRLVFCIDALSPTAVLAMRDCHLMSNRCGIVAKMPSTTCWQSLSSLHARTPFSFVLAVGPTPGLEELFPDAEVECDRSNKFDPPVHIRQFVLDQISVGE